MKCYVFHATWHDMVVYAEHGVPGVPGVPGEHGVPGVPGGVDGVLHGVGGPPTGQATEHPLQHRPGMSGILQGNTH